MGNRSANTNLALPLHLQLRDQLRILIAGGVLGPGAKLPGVRQLADYLGINRHTVSRALHALEEEGFLKTVHSRGTFVTDTFPREETRDAARLNQIVERAIVDTHALGYSAGELAAAILARGAELRGLETDDVCIAFVECNENSLQRYASDLREQLGIRVEPLLISDLHRNGNGRGPVAHCDLVVTTLGHMPEVRRLVGDDVEVFPIALGAYLQVFLSVMALPLYSRVGIVTASEAGSLGMKNALVQAGLQGARLRLASKENPALIAEMVYQVDALVVSFAAMETVKPLLPNPPPQVIEYHNVLDLTGIEALKERLQDLRGKKASGESRAKTLSLIDLRRALADQSIN